MAPWPSAASHARPFTGSGTTSWAATRETHVHGCGPEVGTPPRNGRAGNTPRSFLASGGQSHPRPRRRPGPAPRPPRCPAPRRCRPLGDAEWAPTPGVGTPSGRQLPGWGRRVGVNSRLGGADSAPTPGWVESAWLPEGGGPSRRFCSRWGRRAVASAHPWILRHFPRCVWHGRPQDVSIPWESAPTGPRTCDGSSRFGRALATARRRRWGGGADWAGGGREEGPTGPGWATGRRARSCAPLTGTVGVPHPTAVESSADGGGGRVSRRWGRGGAWVSAPPGTPRRGRARAGRRGG